MKLNQSETMEESFRSQQEEQFRRAGRDLRHIAEAFRQNRANQMSVAHQRQTTSRGSVAVWLARFLFTLIRGPLTRSNQQRRNHHLTIGSERSRTRLLDSRTNHMKELRYI